MIRNNDKEKMFSSMLNTLANNLGYNGIRLVMRYRLDFREKYIWKTVMLKSRLPLKADSWENAAKTVANNFNNGKSLFVAEKIITQDSNGVPEFLIEMALFD